MNHFTKHKLSMYRPKQVILLLGLSLALPLGLSAGVRPKATPSSLGKDSSAYRQALSYHLDRPARSMMEELPLGNGRLGMLSDGGVQRQRITLNESSMWSGSIDSTALNPEAAKHLPEIRQLLFAGKAKEAEALMYRTFVCGGKGSGHGSGAKTPYGSYEVGGFLQLDWTRAPQLSAYRRSLDLQEGISTERLEVAGSPYRLKTLYSSMTQDVQVLHIENLSPEAKSDTLRLTLSRPECGQTAVMGGMLTMSGALSDGKGGQGLRYAILARPVLPEGGQLIAEGQELLVVGAPVVTIYVAHNTNYYDPRLPLLATGVEQLVAAERLGEAQLRRAQQQAFGERMGRVQIALKGSDETLLRLPIDQRLIAYYREPERDPALAALYLQFGRYLLLSSTRPGALPPNLQGLWTNTIQAPWNGDYHLNINLQMNYWPSEKGNLGEAVSPLTDWIASQVRSGEATAKAFYNAEGWVTHILGNLWQFTAPGEHPSWGATNTGAAWLCQHLYNHYRYTQDKAYLERIYPIMHGAARFFSSTLVEDPRNGYLVNVPTTSPENHYLTPEGKSVAVCAGSTMDNQIIRELLQNTIAAAKTLGVDTAAQCHLATLLPRIKPTTIAPDGRIMEWMENFAEAEPHHRHVSHLYGLYPGSEITQEETPELVEAARRSLDARGASSTSWSMAWKVNFRARLGDSEEAYKVLNLLLRPVAELDPKTGKANGSGTENNLFSAHPPFQIDGNFGGASGIMEMLLRSETGSITPLPALPKAWAKGEITGLRVVGNATCSLSWDQSKPGSLSYLELVSHSPYRHQLTLPKGLERYELRLNGRLLQPKQLLRSGRLQLPLMKAGDKLTLTAR